MVTARLPAATASPSAVWNDGQEINATPDAGVPSARYTVSLIVVSAGPCPCSATADVSAISTPISREVTMATGELVPGFMMRKGIALPSAEHFDLNSAHSLEAGFLQRRLI